MAHFKWYQLAIILLLSLTLSDFANAYMTIDQYQESKTLDKSNNTDNTNHYIMGVANGFVVSNITLKDRGLDPFYCQPDTLTIPVSFYRELIEKMLDERKLDSKVGVEYIMLFMLEKAFPCEKKLK